MASAIFVPSNGTTRPSRLRTSRMAPIPVFPLEEDPPCEVPVHPPPELRQGLAPEEGEEGIHELSHIGELPIDRSEPHEGDLVVGLQLLDDPLADLTGLHLAVGIAEELPLDAVDDADEVVGRDRPLLAGRPQAPE